MAKRTQAVDTLRDRVKARLKDEGHGAKIAFGKAIGMKPSSVTSFLSGDSNPTIDKIDAIARYLGCAVPDLFVVRKANALTGSVTPVVPQSTSTHQSGGASDELVEDRLQEQLSTLINENTALRLALDGIADELKTLAAAVKPRKAQGGKTRARGRR